MNTPVLRSPRVVSPRDAPGAAPGGDDREPDEALDAEAALEPDYVRPSPAVWGLVAVGAVFALLTANPVLTVACLLVLPALMALLWRRGEVPILLFVATYQWLQVATKVFRANTLGISVAQAGRTPTVETAVWLGLLAVVVLSVGMRLALRGLPLRAGDAREEADYVSFGRAFGLYLACAVLAVLSYEAGKAVNGLRQIALGIQGLKWAGFFVLGYVVLIRREGYAFLFGATAFEFVQGIGFFSGFKTVLFVLAITVLTVWTRLRPRTVIIGVVGGAVLLLLGAVWTNVKPEYRAFLNQGTRSQRTLVSQDEKLGKLQELVGALSWGDVTDSIDPLLARIEYVDFFAVSMDYVPAVVPHQNGGVWLEAVQNLVPRLFYPGKPRLASDSEHTMEYTGIFMASDGEGTSISLGYVADSYVDFGPVWMYLPLFAIGLLWGAMYRYFMTRSTSALLGFGFTIAVLLTASTFEIASVKLLAGVVVKFLALALALRYAGERASEWLGIEDAEAEWDETEPDEPDEPSGRVLRSVR